MQSTRTSHSNLHAQSTAWVPLSYSLKLLLISKKLLLWSGILFAITVILTWLGYTLSTGYIDTLTSGYFNTPPATDNFWGWIKYSGWISGKWLLILLSRILAFYLSFLFAYTFTTPGYVLLSTVAERLYLGDRFTPDPHLTLQGILVDLLEGAKIGIYGVLITIVALPVNFIPIVGQILVCLIYTFYSALMFIDYPASRRRWSLQRKISWISGNRKIALGLGIVPALIGMIPVLNIFLLAALFPVLTIHATVNFVNNQQHTN